MASIGIVDKTSSSVTLNLVSLDQSWNGETRNVYWYISESELPTENIYDFAGSTTISGSPSSGGRITFGGLEESTRYHVLCTVYHETNLLASLRAEFITDYNDVEPPTVTPWGDAFEEAQIINVTTSSEYVDIYNHGSGRLQLEPYTIHRYTVVFSYSGYAHFYTQSDIDTIGYLSDEPDWNSDFSGPLSDIVSDDDGGEGDNFDIRYNVKANTPYYIFVRGYTGEESGDVTLYVTEPWKLNISNYGTLDESETKSETITISPLTLYRRTMYFPKSGTVTISATKGSIWIGKSSEWKYGMPTDYFAVSNKLANSSFTCEVTTGQVYFVWVQCSALFSGTTTLNITIPTGPTAVDKWNWNASNGSASADETAASYRAVTNKEITTNFFYEVWNDLVDKVKEILDANGLAWDTYYATHYATKMYTPPYELTADMFNSLRNNIKFVYDSGIIKVNTGDDVLGSYFTTLAQSINNAIDII